jgi:HD-like signal output (HDOD) protein
MADIHISRDASASRLEVIRRIRALERIPPPPQEQQRLLAALADPEPDLDSVAALIERCPPVAARIMGVAHSAFFASGAPARSVRDAVGRVLGLRLVEDLVNCVALSSPLQVGRCPGFEPARYWMSAVVTATLARHIAADADLMDADSRRSAYLCGLLHSFGVLVLVHLDPEGMSRVFTAVRAPNAEPLGALELDHLGITHLEAGGRLAVAWGLPPEIRAVMLHYDDPWYRGEHWMLARLVGAATRLEPVVLQPERIAQADTRGLDDLGVDTASIAERLTGLSGAVEELSDLAQQLA